MPAASGIGLCGCFLVAESDRHWFLGLGPPPDGHGFIALEHHVVAEDARELDVRKRNEWRKQDEQSEMDDAIWILHR